MNYKKALQDIKDNKNKKIQDIHQTNINEFKELSASRAYPMAPTTPVPEAVTSKKSMENITFGDIFHSQVYEAFVHLRSMARDLNTPLLPPEFVFVGKRGQGKSALIEAFLQSGLPPPLPRVESPSYFYSLSLVAQSDLLTCSI